MELINYFLHIEQHLREFTTNYGVWVYVLLFAIIFCETGLVVMPFLPGDSLLFAVGALCADQYLNLGLVLPLLMGAAIIGDAVNYSLGRTAADKILSRFTGKVIKQAHIDEAHKFFEKWGGGAIVLARFAPFLRTFVPFVAGMSKMNASKFLTFNIVGGVAWVGIFVLAGDFFGKLPFFQKNIKLLMLGIIFVSLIPPVIAFFRARNASKAST